MLLSNYKRKPEKPMYIQEHKYYYTPGYYQVEWALEQRRLDLKNVKTAQELSRFFYHKMILSKKYTDPFWKDASKLTEDEDKKIAEFKKQFYEDLWKKQIPGYSPLQKAINTLLILRKKAKKDGIPMPGGDDVFEMNVDEAWDGVPDETMFENESYNQLFEQRAEIQDFDRHIDMLQRIALIEDFGNSFEIKKVVNEKRVTNSQFFKQKRMIDYGELVNSQLYQRMLPNYNIKLMTKDLVVNSPITTLESKQKIIILVDFSGSMNSPQKQNWILAIMADRLAYCIKEECEIFFSFFLTTRELEQNYFKWHHIYNKETALEFFKHHLKTNPGGGDTQVGLIIDLIHDEIMNNKKLFNLNIDLSVDQPEILVINDGQDSVKTDKLSWKTNAITLYDGQNSELKALTAKTGGQYILVDEKLDKKLV